MKHCGNSIPSGELYQKLNVLPYTVLSPYFLIRYSSLGVNYFFFNLSFLQPIEINKHRDTREGGKLTKSLASNSIIIVLGGVG